MVTSSSKHNYQIDFLKLVFMIVIVGLHSEVILNKRIIWLSGVLGVEFFFIVSGYLMALSAERRITYAERNKQKLNVGKETFQFVFHKYKIIFPALLISIILCVSIRYHFGDKNLYSNLIFSIWELLCGQMFGFTAYYSTGVVWYLSAMFAAMWMLYPLYLKNKDIYIHIIAPLITMFFWGWISLTYGNLGDTPGTWNGLLFKGMMRGIAGVSAGTLCYTLASSLSSIRLTSLGRWIVTNIEVVCYGFSIYYMMSHVSSTQDTIVVLVLMIAITITFSGQSYIIGLFNNIKWSYCAKFSSVLFFCHYTWALIMSNKMINYSFGYRFCIYFMLSIGTTLIALIIIKIIDIFWGLFKNNFKRLLIQKD